LAHIKYSLLEEEEEEEKEILKCVILFKKWIQKSKYANFNFNVKKSTNANKCAQCK